MTTSEQGQTFDEQGFIQEVLRINLRFNEEIIEGYRVCPFAKAARLDGSSVRRVVLIREPNVQAFIDVIASLEKEKEPEIAVGQIIAPLLRLDAKAFSEFISEVGRANTARFSGGRPIYVYAAFHPEHSYSDANPSRMVPFFRRSPDPFMQVVRLAVLDNLHDARPRGSAFWDGRPETLAALMAPQPESITDKITRENHEAALNGNLEKIMAAHQDIARDRVESYAKFGVRLANW